MARPVEPSDTERTIIRFLDEIAALSARAEELAAQRTTVLAQRDNLMKQASLLGASRARVAQQAGMTRGRVQQIVGLVDGSENDNGPAERPGR